MVDIKCDACMMSIRHNGNLNSLSVEGVIIHYELAKGDVQSQYFHNQCYRKIAEFTANAIREIRAEGEAARI